MRQLRLSRKFNRSPLRTKGDRTKRGLTQYSLRKTNGSEKQRQALEMMRKLIIIT